MFADRLRNIRAMLVRIAQNPVQQRKLRRGAIVAVIAAAGLGGMDFVITGGPDWNPIGADAPRFELVASASAAEHPLLPRSIAADPAPVLLEEHVVLEATLDAHDPNISADDLLGAPAYAATAGANVQLAAMLEGLKPSAAPQIELLVQPLPAQGPWWR